MKCGKAPKPTSVRSLHWPRKGRANSAVETCERTTSSRDSLGRRVGHFSLQFSKEKLYLKHAFNTKKVPSVFWAGTGDVDEGTKKLVLDSCRRSRHYYLIPPLGSRINFHSQQLRALNLVKALHCGSSPEIERNQKLDIAVVGGGLTGITAALGMMCKGHRVVVHERATEPLTRQRRVSDLLCMTDPVHASPKGSMNDHLERNPGRTAEGRGSP